MSGPTPVIYAADLVLVAKYGQPDASILLIRRRWPPFEGYLALPGGHVEPDETAREAARRETEEETGIALDPAGTPLDAVGLYDEPNRDPRGRVVSGAFRAELDTPVPARAGDDAKEAGWHSLELVLAGKCLLAFDHLQIIQEAADAMEATR